MINTESLIDTSAIETLVKDKVAETIVTEINQLLANPTELLELIKHDATSLLVNQLATRYSNIEDDIGIRVATYAERLLENRIDATMVKDMVYEHVKAPIEEEVSKLLKNNIDISNIVESQVTNTFVKHLSVKFKNMNIDALIDAKVNKLFEKHIKSTNGISNTAKQTELFVMNDVVVVENEFIASSVKSVGNVDIDGNLTVKNNFILHGDINVDAKGWVKLANNIERNILKNFKEQIEENLKKSVLEHAKTESIDFESVTIRGKKLVTDNALSNTIVNSNLKKVGQLDNLSVSGEAELNDTLFVVNKRIGINTTQPSMALVIWDEEVEIIAGKSKSQTAFIGTNRKQSLEIGINKKAEITVQDDGLVVINQLRIGKNMIGYDTNLPGYLGGKGDIVFNVNITKDNPVFAWVCIGGHKWMSLKAVV